MNQHHLSTLTNYNLWANKKMIGFILEAGNHLINEPTASSFPTIKKTLFHIWDAQEIWLHRLKGNSINDWPSHSFNGTIQEAGAAIIQNSIDYVEFSDALNANSFNNQVTFKSLDGSPFNNTIEEIVLHVMNHSTFHRGQLITMLRTVGFTGVGSTDLIRFLREQ